MKSERKLELFVGTPQSATNYIFLSNITINHNSYNIIAFSNCPSFNDDIMKIL